MSHSSSVKIVEGERWRGSYPCRVPSGYLRSAAGDECTGSVAEAHAVSVLRNCDVIVISTLLEYGWTYRYHLSSHQGNRTRRYLCWKAVGIKGSRRTVFHLCESRKCRADGGLRDRCTVYRTYDESVPFILVSMNPSLHTQRTDAWQILSRR